MLDADCPKNYFGNPFNFKCEFCPIKGCFICKDGAHCSICKDDFILDSNK